MKKLIFSIAIMTGISGAVSAQTKTSSKNSKNRMEMMKMKEGIVMIDNKAMLYKNDEYTPLEKTYTCSDGCKVSVDGTVTKPDGSTMKLMNGYEIEKNGEATMISHGQKGHVCTKKCPMHKEM